MSDIGRPEPRRRPGIVVVAALALLGAGLSDATEDGVPLHVATALLIAAVTALVRSSLGDRHHRVLRFVSGIVALQPALHLSAKVLPHEPFEHGTGHALGPADLFLLVVHVTMALAIVVAISSADQVGELLSGALRVWRVLVAVLVPQSGTSRPPVRFAPASPLLTSRYRPGSIPRRGPPAVARTGRARPSPPGRMPDGAPEGAPAPERISSRARTCRGGIKGGETAATRPTRSRPNVTASSSRVRNQFREYRSGALVRAPSTGHRCHGLSGP